MSFYPNNPRNIKLIKNLQKEYEVRCCFLASKNQEILKQNQKLSKMSMKIGISL